MRHSGAYLTVLSAFNQPPGRRRVSVAAYPFLDFADLWCEQGLREAHVRPATVTCRYCDQTYTVPEARYNSYFSDTS